jgi:hypothetical protein
LVKFPSLEDKGVLMQVNLQRACKKFMNKLRESYNRAMTSIKKVIICEEDEIFCNKEI